MPAARSLRSAAAARLFSSLRALRSRTVRSRAALACVCCLWFAINAVLSVESRTALLGALSIGGPWRTRPVRRLRPALRGVSTRCRLSRKVPRDTLTLRFADARFRFLSRATRSNHGPSPPMGSDLAQLVESAAAEGESYVCRNASVPETRFGSALPKPARTLLRPPPGRARDRSRCRPQPRPDGAGA